MTKATFTIHQCQQLHRQDVGPAAVLCVVRAQVYIAFSVKAVRRAGGTCHIEWHPHDLALATRIQPARGQGPVWIPGRPSTTCDATVSSRTCACRYIHVYPRVVYNTQGQVWSGCMMSRLTATASLYYTLSSAYPRVVSNTHKQVRPGTHTHTHTYTHIHTRKHIVDIALILKS